MTNLDLSLKVFDFLKKAGVQEVIVCAGARNAPLVMALEDQNFKVVSFFEERSAAFFAIGLMRAYSRPVAVLTTSGTAVAELLPATIEAAYQGLPLILVTADRPKSYRGSGSPQTIEQPGLFSHYVEKSYDLDAYHTDFRFECSLQKPIHLNICFDEPLIDQKSSEIASVEFVHTKLQTSQFEKLKIENPLIILGGIKPSDKAAVKSFVLQSKLPVYAEAFSQLADDADLKPYLIKSSDTFIKKIFQNEFCKSVVRIGSIPTVRLWRDLENEFKNVPVMHFSDLPFTGLSRPTKVFALENLKNFTFENTNANSQKIYSLDWNLQTLKLDLLYKYPEGEPALVQSFSKLTGAAAIYLGNSLPIRNWDQFAQGQPQAVFANRGANGIDGQVSTYLGWSEIFEQSYCLIGDLTALYDLAALGLTNQLRNNQRTIAVMNNQGGQIFNRLFKNDKFINPHQAQFDLWAKMWGWSYQLAQKQSELKPCESKNLILEIRPDAEQTKNFWSEWDQACLKN